MGEVLRPVRAEEEGQRTSRLGVMGFRTGSWSQPEVEVPEQTPHCMDRMA